MKINNILINNFGKLSNFSVDFENGFNIIYGANEDGKTTIMAFIKMMFYGTAGKSGDLSKNLRKKYTPWNGKKMSGVIEFEFNGIVYRLEKEFGASNTTDKVSLWNKANGEKEKLANGSEIGQRFFGIGAGTFEKSAFIGQLGNIVSGDSDKDDEITQKLSNLVSTGDESTSQKKVADRLQTAKEVLKSKGGKIGVLDKQNQLLSQLYDELNQAKLEEEEKQRLDKKRQEFIEQRTKIENSYNSIRIQYDLQQKLIEADNLNSLISKKNGVEALITELGQKKQKLIKGDMLFDSAFVKGCEQQIAQIQAMEEKLAEKNNNLDSMLEQLDTLKAKEIAEVTNEYVESIKLQIKEQQVIEKSLQEIKDNLKNKNDVKQKGIELEDFKKLLADHIAEKDNICKKIAELENQIAEANEKFKNDNLLMNDKRAELKEKKEQQNDANTQYQIAIRNSVNVEEFSERKLEMAREQLKQASSSRRVVINSTVETSEINKPILAIAIISLIAAILLGIFVHPACYAIAVISVVFGAVLVIKSKSTPLPSAHRSDNSEVFSAKENLDNVQLQIAKENKAALDEQKANLEVLVEIKSQADGLQKEFDEIQRIYFKSQSVLSDLDKNKNELNTSLQVINEKISSDTINVGRKKKEIEDLIAQQTDNTSLDALQKEFEAKMNASRELLQNIKNNISEKDCETLDQLNARNNEWRNHQTKISSKSEDVAKANDDINEFKTKMNANIQKLILVVGTYHTTATYNEALTVVLGLNSLIEEIEKLKIKINSQNELLAPELKNQTLSELNKKSEDLKANILQLNNGIMPEKYNENDVNELKYLLDKKHEELQIIKEKLIQINYDIKNKYKDKKCVSEIEVQIDHIKKDISEKEEYCNTIDIAKSTLDEAFAEIRQSFGPMLNTATAEIFEKLTDGKYQSVMISRNFDINIQDSQSANSYEWQYLSNGTIDQAYFALRLAVIGLLTKDSAEMPLFLDDIFMQYDDARTEQGLKFLNDYGKETQVIMFTCHKNVVNLAKGNSTLRSL